MLVTYTALEQDYLNKITDKPISFDVSTSFGDVSIFLFTTFFAVIVAAAFGRYVMAGVYRIQASEAGIRKSNETIKRVTLGLLGVFGLFLVLYTVNRGFLESDINLDGLRIGGGVVSGGNNPVVTNNPGTTNTSTSGGSSKTCASVDGVKSNLANGNICAGTSCTILSGCDYSQYRSIIQKYAGAGTELEKMTIVIMCKESTARKDSINTNANGTKDCGLMQINQPSGCSQEIMNPDENIRRGIDLIKQKRNAVTQTYPGVPNLGGVFASYNCCANGTVPNAPSDDCTTSSGFKNTIPKWACPIKPGDSSFNMCSVKDYACSAVACMNAL